MLSGLQAEISVFRSDLGGHHLKQRLPLISDTVGSDINGWPDLENLVFEIGSSFLNGLQADISDMRISGLCGRHLVFRTFGCTGQLFAIALLKSLTDITWI